jgi:hypothetical protein
MPPYGGRCNDKKDCDMMSGAPAAVWHTRRLFLAGVAACYLFAFASLHAQLPGLIGPTSFLDPPSPPSVEVAEACTQRADGW